MLTAIVLGLAHGARHSIEPDHLAAVSVLAGDGRSSRRGAWLGAMWGFGHTLALVAMGLAVVGFGAALPPAADRVFDLLMAAILIGLGARSILQVRHHDVQQPVRRPLQALAIGAVHGLAGSGALTALVFAALPSTLSRLLYITLFGIGSIAGMAVISGAAGVWLHRIQRPWLMSSLRIAIGVGSIAIGGVTAFRSLSAA